MREVCVGAFWGGAAMTMITMWMGGGIIGIIAAAPMIVWTVCNGIWLVAHPK